MQPKQLEYGYNLFTGQAGPHAETMMDIGVHKLRAGETALFDDAENETALLLLDGEVRYEWTGQAADAARHSLFDEKPYALHLPAGIKATITAKTDAEVLVQKTQNPTAFEPVWYPAEVIEDRLLGKNELQGCSTRLLRDIFNIENAPYSNMVLGEDIHLPGRWSSYPPHHHEQPEVYFYRFDKPQGFGVSIVGDEPMLVMDNSICAIPGGLDHPQAAAPGYAMYYVWMIRHLPGNPWNSRVDNPAHAWLRDEDAKLWEPKLEHYAEGFANAKPV